MQRTVWSLFAAAAFAVAGCGDDSPGGGGDFADAGPQADASIRPDGAITDGDGGAPATDAAPPIDAPVNASGPAVVVLSPTAPPAGNFDSVNIVVADRFTARCKVTANAASGDPVDTSSVRISVFGGGGAMQEAVGSATTVADEYEATMNVASFANGELRVRCTASDLATEARSNSQEIITFLDLGPTVQVFSPAQNSSIANAVDIIFGVSAAPVASGDTGATPNASSVRASIAGVDLTVDLTENPVGTFKATVNFDDLRFNPALDGPQTLKVTAANTRSAVPVTRELLVVFTADSVGPVIVIDSPTAGELISGIVTVSATVTDGAGVDDTSVVATIAGVNEFTLSLVGSDIYAGSFDTRVLSPTLVFPNLVVRARDDAGNQSSVGEVVTLDNQAPIISLDPPDMREDKFDTLIGALQCSHTFDPVGADAADDGQAVPQLFEIRARIEDFGNGGTTAGNGIVIPLAGIDDARVQLFVLEDSTRALIVDTDGDGVCDEINPNLVPTSVPMASDEAAVIDLGGLAPQGEADFTAPPVPPFAATGPETVCNPGSAAATPDFVCQISSPAIRIPKTELGDNPIIYSIPPANTIQCMGNAFDAVATNISDGWTCVAVRAVDNLGNVGISPPLRLCIDRDGDGAEGCPAWGTITTAGLDDCSGTYDPNTGNTDATTNCTFPDSFADFPRLQLRRNDL